MLDNPFISSLLNQSIYEFKNPVFHYCSKTAFESILTTKKLWMTDCRNTNDYVENNLIFLMLNRICNFLKGKLTEEEIMLLYYNTGFNIQSELVHIVCFSEMKDLLSQWIAYADNARGFSIGFKFDRESFYNLPITIHTNRCNERYYAYKMNYIGALPDYDFGKAAEHISDAIMSIYTIEKAINRQLMWDLSFMLRCLNTTAKHGGFTDEREVRISTCSVMITDPDENMKVHIGPDDRIKKINIGDRERSVIEYSFSPENVVEVVLGSDNDMTKEELRKYLDSIGYEHAKVSRSLIPYVKRSK